MKVLITILVSALSAWLLQFISPIMGAVLGGILTGIVLNYKLKQVLLGSLIGGAALWAVLTVLNSDGGGAEVIGGLLGVPSVMSYLITAILGGLLIMLGSMTGHYARKAMKL